jgi:C1A family cysteine protease
MSFKPRGLGYLPGPRPMSTPLRVPPFQVAHAARVFASSAAQPAWTNEDMVDSILDQGRLNSCVSNAAGQAIRMRQNVQRAAKGILPSRLAGYYLARAEDGSVDEDAGTYVHSYFDGVAKMGFASEEFWPYVGEFDSEGGALAKVRTPPDAEYIRLAYDQRDKSETSYHRVLGVDQVKSVIAASYPVVLGCMVDNRFASNGQGAKEVLDPPTHDIAGGHSMVIVGYAGDVFKVCNSWGAGWGDKGYCYFSRAYVEACPELFAVEHVAIMS